MTTTDRERVVLALDYDRVDHVGVGLHLGVWAGRGDWAACGSEHRARCGAVALAAVDEKIAALIGFRSRLAPAVDDEGTFPVARVLAPVLDAPTEVTPARTVFPEYPEYARWGQAPCQPYDAPCDPVPTVYSGDHAGGEVDVDGQRLALDVAEDYALRVLAAVAYQRARTDAAAEGGGASC